MMKKYYKLINGELLIKDKNQIVVNKNGRTIFNPNEQILSEEGWQEYIVAPPTEEQIELIKQQKEVSDSKTNLENSDYKIIKCMEAYLCGEELPYDIQALHLERNNYRNKINKYGNKTNQRC